MITTTKDILVPTRSLDNKIAITEDIVKEKNAPRLALNTNVIKQRANDTEHNTFRKRVLSKDK